MIYLNFLMDHLLTFPLNSERVEKEKMSINQDILASNISKIVDNIIRQIKYITKINDISFY